VRCKYNCLRWQHRVAASGGIAVYECGSSGAWLPPASTMTSRHRSKAG